MVDVTVITPCVPEHRGYLERCKESVRGLNTPALHLIGIDHTRRGAGAVRNALLAKATTPYVIFLDADDTIHPDFIDETLPHLTPKSYVYTGWYEGLKTVIPATPNRLWDLRSTQHVYHLITCLFNRHELMEAGGFDPTLRGMEDKELFLRLIRQACICPIRVAKPLLRYHYEHGQYSRAHEIRDTGEWVDIERIISERYEHKMGCCGISSQVNVQVGVRLEGDVLVTPLWGGNRQYYGRATGRNYGRVSRSHQFYADPRDGVADSQLRVIEQADFVPMMENFGDSVGIEIIEATLSPLQKTALAYGMSVTPTAPVTTPKPPVTPTDILKQRRNKKQDVLPPVSSDDASQFTDSD